MTSYSLFQTMIIRPIVAIYSATRTMIFLPVLFASLAFNFIAFSSSGLALALAAAIEPVSGPLHSKSTLKQDNEKLKAVVRSQRLQLTRAAASLSRAASDIRYRDGQIIGKSLALGKTTVALGKAMTSLKFHQEKFSRIKGVLPSMRSTIVRSASANAASVVAESIPFLGSAVVLAATAVELKELCTLMTQIDSLETGLDFGTVSDASSDKVCGMELPTLEEIKSDIKNSPQAAWEAAREFFPDLQEWTAATTP